MSFNRLTYNELIKARDEGKLNTPSEMVAHAPLFIENEKIADPRSKSGEKFQEYMQEMTNLLLRSEQWKPHAPVQFLLSMSDEENAYVIPSDKVNIMVFTKGILKFLKNKDELAYILGHELGHIHTHDTLGAKRVTKGEEAISDVIQIPWLHQAGLNPRAGVNVMSRFWKEEEKDRQKQGYDPSALIALLDEHPNAALRPMIISNAIQSYARANGITAGFDPEEDEEFKFKPKDKQLGEVLKHAKPRDYFAELAKNEKYDKKSSTQQLEFIRDHTKDIYDGFLPHARPQGLRELIEACDCDWRNADVQALGHQIVEKLVEHPAGFNACYGVVVANTLNKEDRTPVGSLTDLDKIVQAVVTAGDKTQFQQASHRLVEYVEAHPNFKPRAVDIIGFELPTPQRIKEAKSKKNTLPLPWNQHVAWANELAKEGDSAAQFALFYLGVEDRKLFEGMSYEDLRQIEHLYTQRSIDADRTSLFPERSQIFLIAPSGSNPDDLVVNSEKAVIEDSLWKPGAAYALRGNQQPVGAVNNIRSQKEADYAIRKSSALQTQQIDPADSINDPQAFQDWLTKHLPILAVPIFAPMGEEDMRRQDAIYQAVAPHHQQLTQVLERFAASGDEEKRQFVKDFFLQAGTDKFEFLLVAKPDRYIRYLQAGNISSAKYLGDVVAAPLSFPEVEFALKDKHNLFSIAEKAQIYRSYCRQTDDPQMFHDLLHLSSASNRQDIVENLRKVEEAHNEGISTESISALAVQQLKNLREKSANENEFIASAITACPKLLRSIQKVKPFEEDMPQADSSISRLYKELAVKKGLKRDKVRVGECVAFGSTIKASIATLANQPANWPTRLTELVSLYKFSEESNIIANQQVYQTFAERIGKAIAEVTDGKEKQAVAEKLLFGVPIANPVLRNAAIEKWVEGVTQQLSENQLPNIDDKSQKFSEFILHQAEGLKKNVSPSLGRDMLALLAEKVETQRELSYKLEKIFSLSAETLQSSDLMLRAFEAVTLHFSKQRMRRRDLIGFLSSPLTQQSLNKFGDILKEEFAHGRTLAETLGDDYQGFETLAETQYDIAAGQEEDYYKMKAAEIYENYWNFPLLARGFLMDHLLIPPEKRYYEDTSASVEEVETELQGNHALRHRKNISGDYEREAFGFVIGRTLPEGMKYSDQARDFIELYSKVIPADQKNLLLAAMITVDRASDGKDEHQFGIGKRLSMILDMMGPAERKLGQGINSHPSVPGDLRYDARELKFKASPLTRWDAWHEIDRTVHPDYHGQIKHLGKSLGSASFYVTYKTERADGSEGALRMLRKNALPQAKEGFRLLRKFVDRFKDEHQDAKEMCEVMNDLIEQARGMAYTETNSAVGLAQMQHAQKLYNGYEITVDGHTFHFKNANWRAYGPEFMDQEYQHGTHFIELPGDSALKHPEDHGKQAELAYKKAAAKAYITMEFINILSGQSFDHDRHGAQLRINRTGERDSQIGLFDNGAVHAEVRKQDSSLAEPYIAGREKEDDYKAVLANGGHVIVPPPSREEKILLAKTLFKAVQDYLNPDVKRPIADTLYDEVKRIRQDTGRTPDYLLRVQRALLSLNDFFGFEKTNGNGNGHAPGNGNGNGHSQARYIDDKDIADILTGIVQGRKRDERGREQKLIDPEIENAIMGGTLGKLQLVGSWLAGGEKAKQFASFKSDNPVIISAPKPGTRYDVPRFFDAPPADAPQGMATTAAGTSSRKAKVPKWARDVTVPTGIQPLTAGGTM